MEMRVSFRGFEAILKAIREIKKEKLRLIKAEMKRAGVKFKAATQKRVPVEHGILRASIRSNVEETRTGFLGVVGTNVKYGPFLEFGTDRISVGTPENPRVFWPAKIKTGTKMGSSHESMPYLRVAWLDVQGLVLKGLRKVLK